MMHLTTADTLAALVDYFTSPARMRFIRRRIRAHRRSGRISRAAGTRSRQVRHLGGIPSIREDRTDHESHEDAGQDAALSSNPLDFSDPESQRVLNDTALRLARELGRQYARELLNVCR
jgi:hypothetical protein